MNTTVKSNKTKIQLSSWKLSGFYPYTPMLEKSLELGKELKNVIPWIEASVPGSVQLDLYNAGLIKNPYVDQNSILCEWVENRWWVYSTEFDGIDITDDEIIELLFEGIDYKAHIKLNGEIIATHESIVEELRIDITNKVKNDESNELAVILEHIPDVTGQVGHTSTCDAQKSRFNYKWDFTARLVNIGLFKPVYIVKRKRTHIEELYVDPEVLDIETKTGVINYTCKIKNTSDNLELRILFNDNVIQKETINNQKMVTNKTKEITVDLWHTFDKGEQTLYPVTFELVQNETVIDQVTEVIGFKDLQLISNEGSVDALPYTFVVNGEKTYIKGVNMVPIDALFGNITNEKYDTIIHLAKENNINFIRVWGGGLIEHDYFFKLCDENGILVWQEFLQSSSGIDNIPNTDPTYLKNLKYNSIHAVKKVRNHVSLGVWCAGNELTDTHYVPSTNEDANVRMLEEVVKQHDPARYMFPTSASGPLEFGDITKPGLNHDIHGTWHFEGNEKHYTYYNKIDSLFHGEFGVEGMCSMDSMNEFLSEEHIGQFDNNNYIWRHHGAEWWDSLERDEALFGNIDSLTDQIALSQFVQQEGIRYALESNRRRAFQNSGSIVWQLNEPYPNISCTSLLEHSLRAKPALSAVKRAYQLVNPNLSYDKLIYEHQESIPLTAHITSDKTITDVTYIMEIFYNDELVDTKKYKLNVSPNNQIVDHFVIHPKIDTLSVRIHLTVKGNNAEYHNDVLFVVQDSSNNVDQKNVIEYMKKKKYETGDKE